jgi:MFS family permease
MASRDPDEQCEPLLRTNVKYYENCPGCKVEKLKEKRKEYPLKELILLGFLVLCNALPVSSLYSFSYYMVKDFHIGKTKDIGYYAGCIGSSYMCGRFLTSVLWGMAADKYGRKPVMIIGVSSVVVFNTLFGMSINLWMAISMRFLLGNFNGLLGTVKAYASEICRDEHQALCLSVVNTTWGVGLIIGPAIGGFLAQPADKYPKIFSINSLFGRFPYLLPCLCVSIIALIVLLATLWLPETLHNHCFECEEKGLNDHLEFHLEDNPIQEQNRGNIKGQNVHRKSLIKNWPVMSSIIISCVYSFHTTAYAEIFPLWAESPKAFRGLGFTTNDVGVVLSITGVGVLIFQLLVFPPLVNCAGVILITRIAAVLSIPVLTSYPFIAMLSGAWLWVAVTCASLLRNVFSGAVSTGTSLLLNNSVSQDQRGAANGIAVTGISLFQAFGPTAGGSIFAWAQEHQNTSFLPGNEMVFFMLNTIVVIIIVMTFEPFLPRSTDKPNHSKGQLKSKEDEEEPTTKQDEQLSS